jgi:hypothetical protein
MYSEWANSSQLRILNTLPNITLLTPANGNITTNRTPTFTWSGADDDTDSLTYEINISLVASSTCSDTNLYENNNTIGSSTSYTASRYLKCLIDNNDFYNWTVRAYDGEAFGSWAARKNVSVQSDISMSLPVNYILFGAMNMSQSINTTSGSPAPFVLRNDGNALLNISINSSALFVEGSHPSNNLQYKIRNKSGCYEDTGTQTSFTQIPATSAQALNKLNFTSGYQTGCNNVSVDVLVTVPSGEAPGNKSTIVTFISRLGEI